MPTISTLVVAITADTKGLQTGLAQAQGQTAKSSSAISSFGSVAQLAMTGAAVAAIKFGVDSVKAFSDAQAVMAQTENVIASTGGAANVTAKDVLDLATKWQNLSGVQDDAVQTSENLLLTFRDVRNEVGKGNNIFDQATGAILDMSTALNGGAIPSVEDLKGNTIQLGKALNDPIAGMTALKRVGVSFTEAQIETIHRLQQSGNLMGAQKVILGELKKEFGGAAKAAGDTFAGQLAKLQANLNNVQEEIGGALVPQLSHLSTVMNDIAQKKLPSATDASNLFTDALDKEASIGKFLAPALLGWTSNVKDVNDKLNEQDAALKIAQTDILNWAHAIEDGSLTTEKLSAKLDQMGGSAEQVDKTINKVRGTLSSWSNEAENAAKASSGFAEMSVEDFDTWRHESIADLNGVQGSLDDLADKAHLTANEILRAFDKQLQAMNDYQGNWEQLLRRGLPDSLAQQLQEMGLEGANIVAALADANNKKFDQIINDWQKAQGEAEDTANAIDRIGTSVRSLPSSATIAVKTIFTREGHMPSFQHGGVVPQTGPALLHKGETVIPKDGGVGGITININGDVTGEEVVRKVRDGLLKLKARNATTGL
jgi:hypothetical protein